MYRPYVKRGRQRLVGAFFQPSIYNLFHLASYDFVRSGSDTVIHPHCLGSGEMSNASPERWRERQFLIDCRLWLVQRVLWIYSYPLSYRPFKTHTAHYLSVWSPPVNNNCYYSEWSTNRLCYFPYFCYLDESRLWVLNAWISLVLSSSCWLTQSVLLPDQLKEIVFCTCYSVLLFWSLHEL